MVRLRQSSRCPVKRHVVGVAPVLTRVSPSRGIPAVQRKGAGSIQQLVQLRATAVGGDVGAAQVVGEQVMRLPTGVHRDALT